MGKAIDQLASELMQLPESEWQRLKALRDADRETEDACDRELDRAASPDDRDTTN